MKTDQDIIEVPDTQPEDSRPVEVPVIEIIRTPDAGSGNTAKGSKQRRGNTATHWLIGVCAVLAVLVGMSAVYWVLTRRPDIDASIGDDQVLVQLHQPYHPSARGTVWVTDSALGVPFDIYPLDGLKASLEWQIPDTTDRTLVLFMRSADYHPDGRKIGQLVVGGERSESVSRKARMGYAAISQYGRLSIGISTSDKVSESMAEVGGSFFRQYPLIGDGEMPSLFALRGKVPRAAIGRMEDGSLRYFVTRHPETMYGFADAMREYGVVDALYITGGNAYTFWRDTVGTPHIPASVTEKVQKYTAEGSKAPFLVFRTANPINLIH